MKPDSLHYNQSEQSIPLFCYCNHLLPKLQTPQDIISIDKLISPASCSTVGYRACSTQWRLHSSIYILKKMNMEYCITLPNRGMNKTSKPSSFSITFCQISDRSRFRSIIQVLLRSKSKGLSLHRLKSYIQNNTLTTHAIFLTLFKALVLYILEFF